MTEDTLREADRYFAEGDYVRALDELGRAGSVDPEITQRIHTALGRMKLVAAREFAVGRWSVAEGIVDAVNEHDRFLSPAERSECKTLVDAIGRCRDRGKQLAGIVQAAALLASQNQFAESREIALQAMRTCADAHIVARLRHLLRGLPHPLGRLQYGFDSVIEVEQFVRPHKGARVEAMLNESHPLGGGFAKIVLPGQGSSVAFMDPPTDWSDCKELGFTARLASATRSTLLVSVGDLRNSWVAEVKLMDPYWNPVRLTFDKFQKRGEPDWRSVTVFTLALQSAAAAELWLDEIRLRPRQAAL
jgi:hypothetical protein